MKISSRNKVLLLSIIAMIIVVILQFMKIGPGDKKMIDDPTMAVAEVTNWTINNKSKGITITYAFSDGSSTYFGDAVYSPVSDINEKPANTFFPVVYSKADPGLSHLLVIEDDFEEFDKTQPDSLKQYNALFK